MADPAREANRWEKLQRLTRDASERLRQRARLTRLRARVSQGGCDLSPSCDLMGLPAHAGLPTAGLAWNTRVCATVDSNDQE